MSFVKVSEQKRYENHGDLRMLFEPGHRMDVYGWYNIDLEWLLAWLNGFLDLVASDLWILD